MSQRPNHNIRKSPLIRSLFFLILWICMFSTVIGQIPKIKEITPLQSATGRTVNIKGTGFMAGARVFFGGAEGTVSNTSDQLIEAEVPLGATHRNVSVLNPNGTTGYSPLPFMVTYGGQPGVTSTDFEPQVNLNTNSGLYDLVVVDIDGDGLNDIATSNTNTKIPVLLKNNSTVGNLSFTSMSLSLAGLTTINVSAGDLNGDGKPEIIFSGADGYEGQVLIYKNNSTPGSISLSKYPLITIPGSDTKRIAISDLDLDGKPELIITDQGANKVHILINTSTGGTLSFNPTPLTLTVTGAFSTAGIVVNDLNGDGLPEIAVTQFVQDQGNIAIAKNTSTSGNIQFEAFSQVTLSGAPLNLALADLNNDGRPDLAATRYLLSGVVFLPNQSDRGGAITFGDAKSVTADAEPWGIDFGDMDGDGKADLLVASTTTPNAINVLNNISTAGDFSFQKVSIPVTYISRNIQSADMDNDGMPDIVYTSIDNNNLGIPSSKISILRNTSCITPVINEGSMTVCSGNPTNLTTQSVPNATYNWKKDGTSVYSGPNAFYDVTAGGSGSYTVTLTRGSCSLTSDPVNITVVAGGSLPAPTITANDPVCIGGTLTLTTADAADSYQWRGPEGFTFSGQTATLSNFRFVHSGKYYLDLISSGCIAATNSIVVKAINAPDFGIARGSTGPFCEGDNTTLTITPNSTDYSYQWYDQNGAIPSATSNVYTVTQQGDYFARMTDLVNGCPDIDSETVTIDYLTPPQAKFDAPLRACVDKSIALTNQSVIDANATAEYQWDLGDGVISANENPGHTYQTTDIYTVKLTVKYTGLSCMSETTKTIEVQPGLEVNVVPSEESLCEGETIELSVDGTYSTYHWSTEGQDASIEVSDGGTYSVGVTDDIGCEGTGSIQIQAFPKPTVSVQANKISIAPGEEIQLEASGLTSYSWSPSAAVSDPEIYNPTAVVKENTVFVVSGTDDNGCYGETNIEIFIQTDLIGNIIQPKNFFSPNDGDNINAVWVIEKIEQFPQCRVTVVDQTGNVLMESQPYQNNWDGTSQGKRLPSGVYYYLVQCDGEQIVKSGSITLLR